MFSYKENIYIQTNEAQIKEKHFEAWLVSSKDFA